MSRALEAFECGMKDAEHLLARFAECHKRVPHDESEVLKRAALVMVAAAWETYIEDRLRQAVSSKRAGALGRRALCNVASGSYNEPC